jgi:hypothetical protein
MVMDETADSGNPSDALYTRQFEAFCPQPGSASARKTAAQQGNQPARFIPEPVLKFAFFQSSALFNGAARGAIKSAVNYLSIGASVLLSSCKLTLQKHE